MSRPIRFQGAGLIYHVMGRGNNKMRIFLDDLDYARLLAILGETRERFALDVWLVCPMPNHYHLVLRTREANLSLAIRFLNGTYAQWWNRRHAHVGHVFQGRFKAQVVEACTYLLRLCRYVLMNPVRAGLVAHPRDWHWSSYSAFAGTTSTGVDLPSLVRAIDPNGGPDVLARVIEFVDGYADDEMAGFLRRDRRVIGSEAFAAQFTRQARRASTEVPARERRIGTSPLARVLADAVARGDGLRGGVRDAYAVGYPVHQIADCAGLARTTVGRMVKAGGRNRRSGTAMHGPFLDLTPETGASTDLTPEQADLQT
jgi:putative transposase